MKLTITLPYPDPGLSPNARVHFRQKAEMARTARQEAQILARSASCAMGARPTYPVRVTFYPPDDRARDLDNAFASCKPALDGVAQALEVNDKQFRPVTLDWGETSRPGKVVVEIET